MKNFMMQWGDEIIEVGQTQDDPIFEATPVGNITLRMVEEVETRMWLEPTEARLLAEALLAWADEVEG